MDTTSEHPTAPLDIAVRAPAIPGQRLRAALLLGTIAAAIAGIIGVLLWTQIGWLRIESTPPGAQVFGNGHFLGQTPLLLHAFGSTSWDLRIEAADFNPWQGNAGFEPRTEGRLAIPLVPVSGSLLVESEPSGALVLLDGQEHGVTPLVLSDVAVGTHQLALSLTDYLDWNGDVRVGSGASVSQRIALRQAPAVLGVSTGGIPASVYIDGTMKGSADNDIEVEPGQRLVRVQADGKRPWQRTMDFTTNERQAIDVSFAPAWPDPSHGASISPLAIIVENEIHARPQTGLDRADVVYEALAEGGITRFLAVFASQDADVVGPVRSARDYFVAWAHEYAAPLVHVGASPQGYTALSSMDAPDLDEITGAHGFWRTNDRQAPHNLYTSVAGARAALGTRASATGSYSALQFSDVSTKRDGVPASEASIRYGQWKYSVTWTYDPTANEYLRSMDEEPHLDAASGQQLSASNVLVEWVDSALIPGDTAGRLRFTQVGKGRLVALIDGVAIEGYWEKGSLESPSRYFTTDGKPLQLNPGSTWIQVLPATGTLTF